MTCHEYEADLHDHVDRSLTGARVAAVEAHLATCGRCRALITDLRTLRGVAGSLERRTPPAHVWTQIAAGIRDESAHHSRWSSLFTPWTGWRPLAAAAVILVVLSAATWFSWHEVSTVRQASQVAVNSPDTTGQPEALTPAAALDNEIVHLQGIVNEGQAVLPTETKTVYQLNGAAIEHAIGQSRAALASEPSNNLAQQSLFEALRSKLALLQDMVALINEMRKGNQEGAARIVSGMEQ